MKVYCSTIAGIFITIAAQVYEELKCKNDTIVRNVLDLEACRVWCVGVVMQPRSECQRDGGWAGGCSCRG